MSQEQAIYVMQYEDGNWVQRDDSTGPMSTGGYPFKVSAGLRQPPNAALQGSSSVERRIAKTTHTTTKEL